MPSDAELLDAALDAFAAGGYEGTSVRELTRALGVSHNYVHQRFGSKERLWFAAVDHGFSRLAADLLSIRVDEGADDLDRLRATVVRYVESMSLRPALLQIISIEATTAGPRLDYLYDRYIDPVRVFGGELLERLHAAGRVRTDSVALVYFMMTHGAAGSLALPALGRRFGAAVDPADEDAVRAHARAAVDLLFDGLIVVGKGP